MGKLLLKSSFSVSVVSEDQGYVYKYYISLLSLSLLVVMNIKSHVQENKYSSGTE